MNDTVVVDANIIVSTLVSSNRNVLSKFTTDQNISIAAPKFVIVELFKHFERIKKSSKLPENELLKVLSIVIDKVKFYDEASIALGGWVEAVRLCRGTDEKDAAYVALSIELNAKLWTNDKKLKIGLAKKGFNNFLSYKFNAHKIEKGEMFVSRLFSKSRKFISYVSKSNLKLFRARPAQSFLRFCRIRRAFLFRWFEKDD